MRFVRLDFRTFGSFADAPPIEFGGGHGFHMICGPNEAGKSTALRAIRRLLFGFPLQAGDDHRHKYEDLRVGGTVRDESGEELAFLRRKKLKIDDSLWCPDDSKKFDPEILASFLDGLDETRFIDLFSMDHAELIAGGKIILGGGGQIGEMLFAAGSGLSGIDQVRKKLDADSDKLFKPTAKILPINAARADLDKAKSDAKKLILATSAWVTVDRNRAKAQREHDEFEAEISQVEMAKRRCEARAKAIPILKRRDEVCRQLEPLSDVPVLSPNFEKSRRAALQDRDRSNLIITEVDSDLNRISIELADLGSPDPVLNEADAIGQLHSGLGECLKARREQPDLRSKRARVEAEARALLAEFLPDQSIDQAGQVRVLASKRGLISELAQQSGLLEATCLQANRDVEDLVCSLPALVAGSPVSDPDRLAEALAEVIDRAIKAGDLDGQLADERADLGEAKRQALVELRTLPLWVSSLDELESLELPSIPTIDRFANQFRATEEAIARDKLFCDQAKVKLADLEREIKAGRLAGSVPTEDELDARRSNRDGAWRLVRGAWLDGLGSNEVPAILADRFEAATRAADETADRLRREADRIAEQSRRETDRLALIGQSEVSQEELARSIASRDQVVDDWSKLWQPLGLEPLPPGEMKDWVAIKRGTVLAKLEAVRKLEVKEKRAAEKANGFRAELGRGLASLGEPLEDPAESLAALLARAKRAVALVVQTRQLEAARSKRSKAEAARDDWKARWADALVPLGLDVDTSINRATNVLDGLDRAIKAMEESASLAETVAEAGRVERQWEDELGAILHRLDMDHPEVEAQEIVQQLMTRLDQAKEQKTLRDGFKAREELKRDRRANEQLNVTLASSILKNLAHEARCASIDDLEEAERASDEVKDLKKQLQGLDERLTDLADTVSDGTFLEAARAAEGGTIEAEIMSLNDRLNTLVEQRNQRSQEIGGCDERLKKMDGGPAAANARQDVEERVSRLALEVEHYARLRLASAVLRKAVERHREKHQEPVLNLAGALFKALTVGSFANLRPDFDEKGQPILLGVRGDGMPYLNVDGMSEGTADQLYLALRLASLHTYLDDHEPMPLVVDDILVNFDNARALAALRALAELSSRTQVLFFTHHEHLVDLARDALPDDVLFVHRLTDPPVRFHGHAEGAGVEVEKPKRRKKAAPVAGED